MHRCRAKRDFAEEPQAFEPRGDRERHRSGCARLKIGEGGRIVIPAAMRAEMLIKPGDTVTAEVEDGEFRIVSPKVLNRKVQALAEKYKKPGESVVDELISERRAESRARR